MKPQQILTLCFILILSSCSKYNGIPEEYHSKIDQALMKADKNQSEILIALKKSPEHTKEGMAYIISYMPDQDLKTLTSEFLLTNAAIAYEAKEKYPWAKSIPDSVFYNEILPYASLNEKRDDWRKDFHNRFSKYVEQCTDIRSAIDSVNKNIRDELYVDYNTKRKKPDQRPYESIDQGMASCSGLSILLTDAFRSVGIPSRIAGTPNWHDKRGNHNWCEVWIDGKWYFTEYYPSGLNQGWFLADAGKAIPDNPEHAIYASSYKPTGIHFPLVWDESIKYVPAHNVSERYINIYREQEKAKEVAKTHVLVKVMMFTENVCSFQGNDRVATNVDVFCGKDQVGGGKTAGPTQDMNDVLELLLEKDKDYTFNYLNESGKFKSITYKIGSDSEIVKLFYR